MKSFACAKLSHDLFMSPQSGEMVVSVKEQRNIEKMKSSIVLSHGEFVFSGES